MQCQECKSEMEKGTLDSHGKTWFNPENVSWLARTVLRPLAGNMLTVIAWRCPHCKKVELRTE